MNSRFAQSLTVSSLQELLIFVSSTWNRLGLAVIHKADHVSFSTTDSLWPILIFLFASYSACWVSPSFYSSKWSTCPLWSQSESSETLAHHLQNLAPLAMVWFEVTDGWFLHPYFCDCFFYKPLFQTQSNRLGPLTGDSKVCLASVHSLYVTQWVNLIPWAYRGKYVCNFQQLLGFKAL